MNTLRINVHLFFQGALLSYLALFRWAQPMTYLASKVIMPLANMLFFVFLGTYATGWDNVSFYVIGNAMQMTTVSGIYGITMSISGDRWEGTLPYLFATPANRLTIFVGRAFIHVIDGMLGVVLGLTWGVLLLGLDLSQTSLPALALTILLTTFSTSGLGLMLGCLSLVTRNVMFVNNTVFFTLLIFSGANIPIASLPPWMQTISAILPLTRGIAAAREIVAGAELGQVLPLLNIEFGLGLAYLILGYLTFRWFEFQAKQRGTLDAI